MTQPSSSSGEIELEASGDALSPAEAVVHEGNEIFCIGCEHDGKPSCGGTKGCFGQISIH
ncbi:MAG TPA: hypothetical protein VG984_00795 [Candidatus Paceibacterota bacterium]|nr:hypothetical protein [Candidatus Paceibacterota bacterium]